MVMLGLFLMVRNRVRVRISVMVRDMFSYGWVTVTLT